LVQDQDGTLPAATIVNPTEKLYLRLYTASIMPITFKILGKMFNVHLHLLLNQSVQGVHYKRPWHLKVRGDFRRGRSNPSQSRHLKSQGRDLLAPVHGHCSRRLAWLASSLLFPIIVIVLAISAFPFSLWPGFLFYKFEIDL
jgi:hypothetical protein